MSQLVRQLVRVCVRRGAVVLRRGAVVLVLAVAGAALALSVPAAQAARAAPAAAEGDSPSSFTIGDPRITESSGIAASRAHKGIYWTHNDSDDGPYVYAVNSRTGKTVARITLQGVDPRDVEAISAGPDGDVYVGDIGDNLGGEWPEVWIHRFREPEKLQDQTVDTTNYTVRYADGPRDAESMMVHPRTGRVYIASKSSEGKGAIYEGPAEMSDSGVNTFRRIARTDVWASDGAFSPDGTRLVLRSYFNGKMYDWSDGSPSPLGTVTVPMQGQGESVTFAPDGRTLMFGSEGERSTVEPVELDGKLLPKAAAHEKQDDGSQDGAQGGQNDNAQNGGKGDGGDNILVKAGMTFAVALGLWMIVKKAFTRRRSG